MFFTIVDVMERKLIGAILDVDYEQEPVALQHEVLSLQDLCGKKIVSDSYLTRCYISFMPSNIKAFIMRCALVEGRFPTISVLLKNWPYRVFKFPQLPVLKSWLLACSSSSRMTLSKRFQTAIQCVSHVLNVFLDIIQEGQMEMKLKFLDLSAVPLSETSVLRICNFISDNYASVPHIAGNEKCTIKAHCTLNSRNAAEELHSALVKEKMGFSLIRLCICGLTFGNTSLYNHQKSLDLIHMINPADLQIISFNFLSLLTKTVKEVFYGLSTFHNLRVLDFSYFPVAAVGSANFFVALQRLLRELVHVCRIDLRGCKVKNNVNSLLEQLCENNNVPADPNDLSSASKKSKVACSNSYCQGFPSRNLEYLNLSGCTVSDSDLEHLAKSPQARTLKNLNLCGNPLANRFNSFLMLLQAMAPSLRVLEIADTYFRDDQIGELFSVLSRMENLCFLNIGNSRISPQTLLCHLPELCRLPHLKMLCLSAPQSVFRTDICDFITEIVNLIKIQGCSTEISWCGG